MAIKSILHLIMEYGYKGLDIEVKNDYLKSKNQKKGGKR